MLNGKARTMAPIHIEPFDDAAKRKLLKAVADRGQASGLEAAASILGELITAHNRVVGTNTLRDVAAALKDKATRIREQADTAIKSLETV